MVTKIQRTALKRWSKMMLLCFISTTFWQCQKEEFETIDSTKQGKLNLWVVPGEKAFNESKKLRERVTSLKRKNTAARLTSTIYNFSIEEEHVQIIIGDDYTQYTFNVERENPTPNLLENYVCKIYTDGEVFQYLMGYPYSIGQNGISYQMQNSTIQVISDENIVVNTAGRGFPPGCVPEFLYEVITYECINYPCTGDGHTIHQSCDCDGISCNRAYTNCSWVTTAFYGGCGGDGGFTPPAGGGSTNPDTNTPTDPVVTVPFEIKPKLPCEQLKDNLKPENENIKNHIDTLMTLLNLPDERSISFKKFVTPDEPDEIIPLWNTGVANTALFMTGGSWYGNIHTHPIGYYSMFSWVDLKNTRDLYRDASANKKASVFSMIVCHNNEVYSLKVDNFLTLDIAIDLDFNNPAYNGFRDKL